MFGFSAKVKADVVGNPSQTVSSARASVVTYQTGYPGPGYPIGINALPPNQLVRGNLAAQPSGWRTGACVVDRRPLRKGTRNMYGYGGSRIPLQGAGDPGPRAGMVRSSEAQPFSSQWIANVQFNDALYIAGAPAGIGGSSIGALPLGSAEGVYGGGPRAPYTSFKVPLLNGTPVSQPTGAGPSQGMTPAPRFNAVQRVFRYSAAPNVYPTSSAGQ